MDYVVVEARFLFYNGNKRFTVEYLYALGKWFVFNEQETENAIFIKPDKRINVQKINMFSATEVFNQYLESLKITNQ